MTQVFSPASPATINPGFCHHDGLGVSHLQTSLFSSSHCQESLPRPVCLADHVPALHHLLRDVSLTERGRPLTGQVSTLALTILPSACILQRHH